MNIENIKQHAPWLLEQYGGKINTRKTQRKPNEEVPISEEVFEVMTGKKKIKHKESKELFQRLADEWGEE